MEPRKEAAMTSASRWFGDTEADCDWTPCPPPPVPRWVDVACWIAAAMLLALPFLIPRWMQ